jgi:uncharacterized repeat protein (TIGR03803 family)
MKRVFAWIAHTVVSLLVLTSAIALAQGERVLYTFGENGDAESPLSVLISDRFGNLYGTTYLGGAFNRGAVFELLHSSSGSWTEQVLYSFGSGAADGSCPLAGLVFDHAGNLYGTTSDGNGDANGTVFELSPPETAGAPWAETVLYSFGNVKGNYGFGLGGLVFGKKGVLYGVASGGGTGLGSVFELRPPAGAGGAWSERTIYAFTGGAGGENPAYEGASLTFDASGNLYGVAGGGTYTEGVVFELSPPASGNTWTETVLHTFGPPPTMDGAGPLCRLGFDAAGNLYGTTAAGGDTNSYGTVFELSPPSAPGDPWTETILYEFNGDDGYNPRAGVVFDKAGNLYGTTFEGGAMLHAYGTVYELKPPALPGGAWTHETLYAFTGATDGRAPYAALVLDPIGNLYGTTSEGGLSDGCHFLGCGVVFEVEP